MKFKIRNWLENFRQTGQFDLVPHISIFWSEGLAGKFNVCISLVLFVFSFEVWIGNDLTDLV